MKISYKDFQENCSSVLKSIAKNHTQSLLEQEEILIRTFLAGALKGNAILSDECPQYWGEQATKARAHLSDQQKPLSFRESVTSDIRNAVNVLHRVNLTPELKQRLIKDLTAEMKKCITELFQSKKKRTAERKMASALTESSIDIPGFDPNDSTLMPANKRDGRRGSMPDKKPRYQSGRHRSRSARMH